MRLARYVLQFRPQSNGEPEGETHSGITTSGFHITMISERDHGCSRGSSSAKQNHMYTRAEARSKPRFSPQILFQVRRFALAGTVSPVRPRAGTLAALSLAIALAGCGGSSGTSAQEPALPRAVVNDLAGKSDEIADALDSGDVCGAAGLADQLKEAVEAAVSGGQVPPAFQDELEQTATDLQNEVNCEEKPKDKGKGKKKGHDDETTTLGTTVSTTTEVSD
jgi:hypothetical protein